MVNFSSIVKGTLKAGTKATASSTAEIASKQTAKNLAANAAKATIKESVESTTKTSLKAAALKAVTSKVGLATVAGVGVGSYVLIDAGVKAGEKNNENLTITKYELNPTNSNLKITFENPKNLNINTKDTITISGSDTIPKLDGKYNITQIVSPDSIEIKITSEITNFGNPHIAEQQNKGIMTIHSTFESQIDNNVGSITNSTGEAIGTVGAQIGKSAGTVLTSAAGGVATGVADSMGFDISSVKSFFYYIFILLIIVACVLGVAGIFKFYHYVRRSITDENNKQQAPIILPAQFAAPIAQPQVASSPTINISSFVPPMQIPVTAPVTAPVTTPVTTPVTAPVTTTVTTPSTIV